MPYIPFTEEEKLLANSVNLPEFLRNHGEKLERAGREYKLIYTDGSGRHDSITISGSTWYDHKNQVGGGAIRFVQQFYGKTFPEAVQMLLGGNSPLRSTQTQPIMAKEEKEFTLPEVNKNMHRVYAYLIKQRCISPEILTFFARQHSIYEEKKHHNAVFVGLNKGGVPKQAHMRSTSTYDSGFRITCEGSDTRYSFAHFGESDRLFVFEAPIDMLSYITLHPENWQDKPYTDKAGFHAKSDNLRNISKAVMQDLRRTARTKEQTLHTAKLLYDLADCAVRCETEIALQTPVEAEEEMEEEPCLTQQI